MPKCENCGQMMPTLRGLKRHAQREHPGELETPEEHLPDDDSEQRDFDGEEPDDSDHDPEYVVTNDPPEGEDASLLDFDGDNDG